jgi:hypothetical protein
MKGTVAMATKKQRKPATPDVPGTTQPGIADAADRARTTATPSAATGATPPGMRALDLIAPGASSGLLDSVLEIVGAETLTLQQALTLWQREQDRILNRAWRRPGGLARPAGL